MKVNKNEMVRIELIVRTIEDGRRFYRADLFRDWHQVTTEDQDGTRISYEGEKVTTHIERPFIDDVQAWMYYEENFEQEYAVAEEVTRILEKKAASDEARLLLQEFDYVTIKMTERMFSFIKELRQDLLEGGSVSFDQFVKSIGEMVNSFDHMRGGHFFMDRENQRDIVNGIELRTGMR